MPQATIFAESSTHYLIQISSIRWFPKSLAWPALRTQWNALKAQAESNQSSLRVYNMQDQVLLILRSDVSTEVVEQIFEAMVQKYPDLMVDVLVGEKEAEGGTESAQESEEVVHEAQKGLDEKMEKMQL